MNGTAGVLEAAEPVVPAPRWDSSSPSRRGVLDLLREHAERRTHETALVFAQEQGDHAELTWAQLQRLVHAHAAHIAAGGAAPGDTVVVLSSSVAEQVLGFLGAIAAGCVPTIVSYPSSKQSADAFEAMLRPVLVHSRARLLLHGASFAPHVGGLAALTTLRPFAAAAERPPPLAAVARRTDAPLFLQFSSGTTGARKAVAVSERMLMNQAASYAAAIGLRTDDKVVSWLPLYHDMGLVAALLIPLCHGVTGIHLSPFDWLTRPEMLFELIERHRATLLWLPNFAYELCAQRIDARCAARLGTLRGIVNCSEPVRPQAHERFLDAFGALGVRAEMLQTCYAMAETTFAVTQSSFGRPASVDRVDRDVFLAQGRAVPAAAGAAPGQTLAMVSSGRPIEGAQVRIAGAAGERRVGEIEVHSDSMFGGYLFNADGADTLGADGWLRTGDLGYVAGGELYVTGRSKDLIIRRGHNIDPTDIEEVVAQVEGCKGGRVVAFGIDDPGRGTQDVVVMAERAGPEVDAQSLRCAIRERLLTAMNETPGDVLVCEPNTLRKSTSGKLSRSGNRQLYLE
ncbi:partial fatty-acyl-CoA synthase, partial [Burkholderiaceae bacterium]